MGARDKFVGIQADYWDCRDSEQLTHEDPISALEEYVEIHLTPGCDVEKEVRDMGDISVEAYVRGVIDESDVTSAAEFALESACDHFSDNYGDPDGEYDNLDQAKHLPAFEAVVRALYADAKVWRCEVAQTVVVTPDEVLEILRVERPDWFEPSDAA